MKKALIVYFSGTGNSKAIAQGYEMVLKNLGYATDLHTIEALKTVTPHDVLVIGGPIYAGNFPDELINWTRKSIPVLQTPSKAIVYSTSAGLLNAHGVKSIGKKLLKKGYQVVDTTAYEMPRNFYIDKYAPTSEVEQRIMFEKASKQIPLSLEKLSTDPTLSEFGSTLSIDLFADLFRIMAKSMGKNFSITDKCINCGRCERDCPKGNIRLSDKKYLNKCMLCTRCIHNCPVNAITYKDKKIDQYKVHYNLDIV